MFKLFFLFIIMPVLIIFLVGGFTVFKFLFRVKQMSKQFGANGGYQQQRSQRRTQQRAQQRTNNASADETLYDSRSTEDRNKKIFAKEEGEYVDYEEVK